MINHDLRPLVEVPAQRASTTANRNHVGGRGLAALVLLLPVLGGCGNDEDGALPETSRSTSSSGSSTTLSPTESEPDGSAETDIDLGGEAWSAKYGFGGVWVQVDPPVDKIVKVDVETSEVVLEIDGGRGFAIGADAVWVAMGAGVQKIDPTSGDVLLSLDAEASYVAVDAGSVWVPTSGDLQRFDPDSGALVATIPVTSGDITELAVSDDAVWLTSKGFGGVFRVDPATNTVVTWFETGLGAHGVVIAESGVWVTNYRENSVSRIDPATNTVVATVPGVGSGVGIDAADGAIWVSTQSYGISRIDPATNQAMLVAELPGWSYGVACHDGALWVSNVGLRSLSKVIPAGQG